MSEEKKKDLEEMVDVLKDLDEESLLILNTGAQMLKARQDMSKTEKERKDFTRAAARKRTDTDILNEEV